MNKPLFASLSSHFTKASLAPPGVPMAPEPETLTDYERRRLDNIRRNGEMMRSLKAKASALSSFFKRPCNRKPKPKPGEGTPVLTRRSLRTRGISPPPLPEPPAFSHRKLGPFLTREALVDAPHDSDSALIAAILGSLSVSDDPRPGSVSNEDSFDPRSELVLRPETCCNFRIGNIKSARFLPLVDRAILAVGNCAGNLGFWDANFSEEDEPGLYVYSPHSALVSGIFVSHFSPAKIFSSSYDRSIRVMDVEKEMFSMLLSSENFFYSISGQPRDVNSIYIGEGRGMMKVWDERAGRASSSWDLHYERINTIDFNLENVNLMATSSSDGYACIWDLRSMKESIREIIRESTVHSAYFSPSGNRLAIKNGNTAVAILGGANFDDLSVVYRKNITRASSAIWGWDDSYLYISNASRSIDILSTDNKRITRLTSPHMTATPHILAAHPYMPGHLAGASSHGAVFLWKKGLNPPMY